MPEGNTSSTAIPVLVVGNKKDLLWNNPIQQRNSALLEEFRAKEISVCSLSIDSIETINGAIKDLIESCHQKKGKRQPWNKRE